MKLGTNDLLNTAQSDLDRAEFRADLILTMIAFPLVMFAYWAAT